MKILKCQKRIFLSGIIFLKLGVDVNIFIIIPLDLLKSGLGPDNLFFLLLILKNIFRNIE